MGIDLMHRVTNFLELLWAFVSKSTLAKDMILMETCT